MRSLSCAALLALLLAACGTSYTSTRVADPVLVAKSDSPAEVRAAVVRALAARKFIAKSEEPGKIVAELDRGSEKLVVAVEYSSTQYLVRYVSSSGLKTKPGPGGDLLAVLDEKGELFTSVQLAERLRKWTMAHGEVAFLIGDAFTTHGPST